MYLEGKLIDGETTIRYIIIKEFSCTEDGHCDISVRGFETKSDMSKYFNLRDMEEEKNKKQFTLDRNEMRIQEINKEIEELQRISKEDPNKAEACNANIKVLQEDIEILENDSIKEEYKQAVKDCENYDKDFSKFNRSYFPVIENKTSDTDITRDLMYTVLLNYVDEFKEFKIVEEKVEIPIIILENNDMDTLEKEDDIDASTNS